MSFECIELKEVIDLSLELREEMIGIHAVSALKEMSSGAFLIFRKLLKVDGKISKIHRRLLNIIEIIEFMLSLY